MQRAVELEVVEAWVQQLPEAVPSVIQLIIEGGPEEKEASEHLRECVDDIVQKLGVR